jgi:hypothetical protein
MSMEMASPIIIDLRPFDRRRDLPPGVNGGVGRLNSLGMVLQILLRQINFGSFLLVAARRIIFAVFVPTATSSTMVICTLDSPAMSIKLFGYFSLIYWCCTLTDVD